MKFIAAQAVLLTALCALPQPAHAWFVDAWRMQQAEVRESTAQRGDGSLIRMPRSEEVLVEMRLQTRKEYGNPEQRVLRQASAGDGKISLTIQTPVEFECEPREDGGWSLNMTGKHYTVARVIVKPGSYAVQIDNLNAGTLVVTETSATFQPSATYEQEVHAIDSQIFAETFELDPSHPIRIETPSCKLEVRDVPTGFDVAYQINGSTQTLSNGDTLTRPTLTSTTQFRWSTVDFRCQNHALSYVQAQITGDNRDRLSLTRRIGGPVRASFQHGASGRGCSN